MNIKRVHIKRCSSPQWCVTKREFNQNTKKEVFEQTWFDNYNEAKKFKEEK